MIDRWKDVSLPTYTLIQLSEVHANADLAILLGDYHHPCILVCGLIDFGNDL